MLQAEPALYDLDHEWSGFEWINLSDSQSSVISFLRKARDGSQLMCVFNLTPVTRHGYRLGCRHAGFWREVFNSDSALFGGSDQGNLGGVQASQSGLGMWPNHVSLTLPPLAGIILKPE